MSQQDQLGVCALKLLAEESMVAVLRGLAEGALRPAELEHALPDVGHSVLMRRLRHLLESELVTCEHQPGLPPHARSAGVPREAHYSLTDAGRMLLEVTAEACRWEEIWCPQDERRGQAGVLAIKLIADDHTREIMLLLADGPLSPADLGGRVCDLGRSALRRRLGELVLGGLLEQRKRGRVSLYELTAGARHLALVALLAGRWEWQWSRPQHPAPGRDLHDLLHLLAPVARIPEPIAGICRLHLDVRGADDPDDPIRPAELERGLPDAGHAVVIRRLRRLLHGELVSCERQFGLSPHPRSATVPRRAYYSLTDSGRMLLEVTAEADRWEWT
jgi:DNA-binding HxlR family transcriptional regulator